ncbi:MAG: S1 RNA-binding domain-containing protein [Parcubacteria group bacterium]|nr:S1 RNA-binding domain-containing protein [Parcubacteria group bacterium]
MIEENNTAVVIAPKEAITMKELLQEKSVPLSLPKVGDVMSGTVIEKARNRIYLDLNGFRTAVLYKTEIEASNNNFQDIKKGDGLTVKIIELENKDGYVEVSLTQASLDQAWEEVKNLKSSGEPVEVKITGANRGGLVSQLDGLDAFLPVSQLSSAHYPHVEGGDKEENLKLLKKFIGQMLTVKVLDYDQKNNKIILSEKAKVSKELETKLTTYALGDIIEGEISGLVDFGAFVTFNDIEGLIHISEIGWQLVEKPSEVLKIGEKIQAKIIDIGNDKVSLSLKALKPNPWDSVESKYKKGDVIMGTVVKFNPFGAFVKLDTEIQGLAHISEFKTYKDMTDAVELGKNYPFKVTMLEPKEYKLALQPAFEFKTSSIKDNPVQS